MEVVIATIGDVNIILIMQGTQMKSLNWGMKRSW